MSPSAEFEELVRAHSPTLRRFCRRLAGPTDGDDLMQETLTRAMTSFGTLRDVEHFLPWCRQIARNTHTRRVQTAHQTEPLEDRPAPQDVASQVVDQLVLKAQINACLAELPEHSRRVVLARAEGVPPTVLATELGVSRGLIDTWYSRSKAKMQSALRHVLEAGSIGAPGVRVLRFLVRHRLTAVPVIVATGLGVTALMLLGPHLAIPNGQAMTAGAPAASQHLAVTAHAPRAGPTTAKRATADAATSHSPDTRERAVPVTENRHVLGLPRTTNRQAIVDAAHEQPIVIGPLLPDNQLLLGLSPCGLIEILGAPCLEPLPSLHLRVGLPQHQP
jgi:RNA polymerase sigma factor (sigma-70 family)